MSVEVSLDPGSTWRIPGEPWERSWRRMRDLASLTALAGAQTFKSQWLRAGMYADGTQASKLVAQYEIPDAWLPRLRELCDDLRLELRIAPYRAEDVARLQPFVNSFKVASF